MEALKKLGLTKYESAIYTCLLKIGRSKASDISDKSKVPITAVYPNLKTLIKKQLVQQFNGDPSLYEAINPKLSINSFIKNREKEYLSAAEEIIRYAESVKEKEIIHPKKEVLKVTHGKELSKEVYLDALNKVTERYRKLNKKIHLRHLSEDCRILLNNASEIIDVNYWEDPHYKVIVDTLEG